MSSSALSPAPKAHRSISGPSPRLDARVNAIRSDLADIALVGRIVVPRYATAVAMCGALPASQLYAVPDRAGVCVSELLYGEGFAVFDRAGDWAWGQCAVDGYVGWLPAAGLAPPGAAANRTITAPLGLLFAGPSIKSAVVATLPLNARLSAQDFDADFLSTGDAFIHRRHVAGLGADVVDLALSFIGTPYRWGGRTRAGLDCSGLTQAVLMAHGIACPRDSDQQLAAFPPVPFEQRRRGDLVAFPGHVGLLADAATLVHANAFHMTTLAEPLAAVVARLQPLVAQPVLGVVRPL